MCIYIYMCICVCCVCGFGAAPGLRVVCGCVWKRGDVKEPGICSTPVVLTDLCEFFVSVVGGCGERRKAKTGAVRGAGI